MNSEVFLNMIHTAIIASIISLQLIQKIKHILCISSKYNKIMAIFISFFTGYFYAISFYSSKILYAIWIGLYTLIGAEAMYKTFNGFFGLKSVSKLN